MNEEELEALALHNKDVKPVEPADKDAKTVSLADKDVKPKVSGDKDAKILESGDKEVKTPFMQKILSIKKLAQPFNSENDDEGISFTTDGLWIYFSSNRVGGEGQFDIYRSTISEDLRKPYAFELKGIVVDGSEQTMIGLDSTIKISNEKGLIKAITSRRIGGDITSPVDKEEPVNFRTRLLTSSSYKIEVSSPGFHPTEFTFDLTGSVGMKKSKYVKIVLMPVEEESIPDTQISKPDDPINKDKPDEIQPDKKMKLVILKDANTKKSINGGKVTLFEETKKEGILLPSDKEGFRLEKYPSGAFELLGSAKGYVDETLIIKSDDKFYKGKQFIEIYLHKKSEQDPIYEKIVYFTFNESVIKVEYKKLLDEFAGYLNKNKDIVEIGGHTDNVAGKDFNYELSLKRSENVKKYLISKGIEENRLIVKAYWYSQPATDNSTEEGRTKNRRVAFKKLK
jgi:peptidoglycan-associated lipoprotein